MENRQKRNNKERVRLHSLTKRSNKCELLAAVLLLSAPWPEASPTASGQRGYGLLRRQKRKKKKLYNGVWVKTLELALWAPNSNCVAMRSHAGFKREQICFQICTLLPHLCSKTLSPFTATQSSHLLTLSYICCKEGINFAAICTWFEPLQSFW